MVSSRLVWVMRHDFRIEVGPWPLQRINRCLNAQRTAANAGFPCAKPLTKDTALDGAVIVSAEE